MIVRKKQIISSHCPSYNPSLLSQTVFLFTAENSLKHGSSVEVIIVSVWWWVPPAREACTYSTADNSTAMRRRINCLTPAASHYIPPARLLRGNPAKTLSENVLSPKPPMRCAPLDLLCPFILPLKRPAVPLIVGGK